MQYASLDAKLLAAGAALTTLGAPFYLGYNESQTGDFDAARDIIAEAAILTMDALIGWYTFRSHSSNEPNTQVMLNSHQGREIVNNDANLGVILGLGAGAVGSIGMYTLGRIIGLTC